MHYVPGPYPNSKLDQLLNKSTALSKVKIKAFIDKKKDPSEMVY